MNESREKLIISADDFGISPKANKNILSLIRAGKIDRVAVLVDYGAGFSEEEAAELGNCRVKIDLHLNLKNFDVNMERSQGVARRIALFLRHYFSQKDSPKDIEVQWQEQIDKFTRLFGKIPDGINSHQYIHFFPPYFKIIVRLGEKYRISYLRFGKKGIMENTNSISEILHWLWKSNEKKFSRHNFKTSDFLVSYDWIKNLSQFLEKLPPGKTELILHPEKAEEFEILNKYF